ncbi:GYD domain-containing protein [Thalassotalea psychrophila]|uniref:GYD domain-containing protein n=1 Tax=Thalassotalea psychrophila TaxID=3065647 RepID=A0ABY9U2S5_9GAMM|nr:GYD domain-containing protein [Colwelliaceae bacterium SQ149]
MIKQFFTVLALVLVFSGSAFAADKEDNRHFMFIGEPNAAAWKYLIDNPADRKSSVEGAFKALGGEVISYYFGLGDGKNYITVTIPNDNELIQAIYLMRLPSGLLNSYKVVELMPSEQMTKALIKTKKMLDNDTTL